MMRQPIATAVCAALLAGCATEPVSTAQAANVPASRVFDASLLTARPGASPIVIKRDSGMSGAACNVKIFVNGSAVADLATSEKITLHMPPGRHMLGARHNCTGSLAEQPLILQQPIPHTFRIGMGFNGEFTLQQTAF